MLKFPIPGRVIPGGGFRGTHQDMRLTAEQIEAIKNLAKECFGDDAIVYLFGSRADESRRGGDIDLSIETKLRDLSSALEARSHFLAKLKLRIGDQRIDVVVDYPDRHSHPAIIDVARQTGVRL